VPTSPKTLKISATPGASTSQKDDLWRLEIPGGSGGEYRLAQLDDYRGLPRAAFPHQPPQALELECRASGEKLPGTWGFGLWNDPFSLSLGLGGGIRRFPALPNAAWFFFASPPNYLSFRDDLPAQGSLAAVFRGTHVPAPMLALGAPLLGLLAIPILGRRVRSVFRRWIKEEAAALSHNPRDWHHYRIEWEAERVSFWVDGFLAAETGISPQPPLGFVLWIDNQYAALPPDGRLAYGSLPNPEAAWIEVRGMALGTPGAERPLELA
jgi:hypothetical protein